MKQLTKTTILTIICFICIACTFLGCEKSSSDETVTEDSKTTTEESNESTSNTNSITGIKITGGTLSPEFQKEIISYNITIPQGTETISINPSCEQDPCNFNLSQNGQDLQNPVTVTDENDSIYLTIIESSQQETTYIISVTIDSNLIKNSSFEQVENDSLLHWQVISSGTFNTENSTLALQGSKVGYFSGLTSSISGREILSAPFAIESLKPLEASAFFYTQADPSHTKVSLKIWYFQDEACTIPASDASNTQRSLNLEAKDSWQKVIYEQSADRIPADALFGKLSIRVMYDSDFGSSSDIVYVDNVQVIQSN